MSNDYDVPEGMRHLSEMTNLLRKVLDANCGDMIEVPFLVSENDIYFCNEDPLPPNMIMAAHNRMAAEIPEADLLTEEDELTEDYDRTLENYFESPEFQADLFKLRWSK